MSFALRRFATAVVVRLGGFAPSLHHLAGLASVSARLSGLAGVVVVASVPVVGPFASVGFSRLGRAVALVFVVIVAAVVSASASASVVIVHHVVVAFVGVIVSVSAPLVGRGPVDGVSGGFGTLPGLAPLAALPHHGHARHDVVIHGHGNGHFGRSGRLGGDHFGGGFVGGFLASGGARRGRRLGHALGGKRRKRLVRRSGQRRRGTDGQHGGREGLPGAVLLSVFLGGDGGGGEGQNEGGRADLHVRGVTGELHRGRV
mmetsp:Transcript_18178/g.36740  ORF Transcript_18178/g.36740 Transcript_18178/m.36740 type:complete len:259 (+) Transcript_18178:1003-1779(+)